MYFSYWLQCIEKLGEEAVLEEIEKYISKSFGLETKENCYPLNHLPETAKTKAYWMIQAFKGWYDCAGDQCCTDLFFKKFSW